MNVWRVAYHTRGHGGTHTAFALDPFAFRSTLDDILWFYIFGYGYEPEACPEI